MNGMTVEVCETNCIEKRRKQVRQECGSGPYTADRLCSHPFIPIFHLCMRRRGAGTLCLLASRFRITFAGYRIALSELLPLTRDPTQKSLIRYHPLSLFA